MIRRRRKPTLEQLFDRQAEAAAKLMDAYVMSRGNLIVPESLLPVRRPGPWARFCAWVDRKLEEDTARLLGRREERDVSDVVPLDYWEDRHP